MVNLTLNELRVIRGRRGIENYKNMSREKVLNTEIRAQFSKSITRRTRENCKNSESFTK